MMPLSLPLESIEEEEEEEEEDYYTVYDGGDELEGDYDGGDELEGSLFSIDFSSKEEEEEEEDERCMMSSRVHVAVDGKSESSMDGFVWTLKEAVTSLYMSSSLLLHQLILIHVFPPIRFIPSPLGMLPKSKVSPKLVENYMAKERDTRKKLLDKYVDACSTAKVKVDIMLVESDTVAKAILDLIPTYNITKLVVGTTKSSMRKLRSKKGNGIANQILRNAPETCDVKIICKGTEVVIDDQMNINGSRSVSARISNANSLSTQDEDQEVPISPHDNKEVTPPSGVLQDTTLNGYNCTSQHGGAGILKPK